MNSLKLTDSIFDTSTDKNDGWDFSGIVKDNVATNSNNSDIVDVSKSTAYKPTETTTSGSFFDSMTKWWGGNDTPKTTTTDKSMFSSENIGSTLQGAGAVVGGLSGIYGTLKQEKFNKEVLGMEKDRINRNIEREDKLQKNYQGVWS